MNRGVVSSGKQAVIKNFTDPSLQERGVIIEHKSFGLNYDDIKVLDGRIKNPNQYGILGIEAAGVVLEVSSSCNRGFKIGDRVCYATYHPGALLERRNVHENYLIPLPNYLNFEAGATILKGLMTLTLLGKIFILKPPAFILLSGASGGVGTYMVQLAARSGFNVIALTSSDSKKDYLKSLGAFAVINYKKESVIEALKTITKGEGVNFFFDCLGREVQPFAFNVLRRRGFFIQFGAITGEMEGIKLSDLREKSITVTRVVMTDFIKNRGDLIHTTFGFMKACQSAIIKPVITSFPFDKVNEAFIDIKNATSFGHKIINIQ